MLKHATGSLSDTAATGDEVISYQPGKAPSVISFDLKLDVTGRLFDDPHSEHFDLLTLFVSGLPKGATLNHGIALSDDTYSLAVRDLSGLELRLTEAHPGVLTLRLEAIARDLLTGESVARKSDVEILCDEVTARKTSGFDPLMDQVLSSV